MKENQIRRQLFSDFRFHTEKTMQSTSMTLWMILSLLSSSLGRTSKSSLTKDPAKQELTDSTKSEGSPARGVHFEDEEEMERKSEASDGCDDDLESAKVFQVPSFFISKPLVDFDAGSGRVMTTISLTIMAIVSWVVEWWHLWPESDVISCMLDFDLLNKLNSTRVSMILWW